MAVVRPERRGIGVVLVAILLVFIIAIAGIAFLYFSSSKTGTPPVSTASNQTISSSLAPSSSVASSSSPTTSSSSLSTSAPPYPIGSVLDTYNLCTNQLSPGNVNGSNGGSGCLLEPEGVLPDTANGILYISHTWNLTVIGMSVGPPASFVTDITGTTTSEQMVYDPANHYVYATNYESYGSPNQTALVSVINPDTEQVIKNITIGTSFGNDINSWGVALDPSNGYLYVASYCDDGCASGNISVISTATETLVKTMTGFGNCANSPGCLPEPVLYDPANGDVYVGYLNAANITLIDTATNSVAGSLNLTATSGQDSSPAALAYDPTNGYIYAADESSSVVTVINATSNAVVETIGGENYNSNTGAITFTGGEYNGTNPWGMTFDSAKDYIYVSDFGSNDVSVINCATNSIIGMITVGPSPRGIAYDPANGLVYVANHFGDTVSIIG